MPLVGPVTMQVRPSTSTRRSASGGTFLVSHLCAAYICAVNLAGRMSRHVLALIPINIVPASAHPSNWVVYGEQESCSYLESRCLESQQPQAENIK